MLWDRKSWFCFAETKIPKHMVDYCIYINGQGITLTEAKLIVLHLHCFPQKQMAEFLILSKNTVKTYVRFLHSKLNVHCVAEVIRLAIKEGFDIDGMYEEIVFIELEEIRAFKKKYRMVDLEGGKKKKD